MRISKCLVFVALSIVVADSSAGVLEKTARIQVGSTILEHPDRVDDRMAANLVRYDLRAAVRDAHLEEGESAVRVYFVLDQFSSEGRLKRLMNVGSGRSTYTVDGKLVFQESSGRELASVTIHVHGTIVPPPADASDEQTRKPMSDLERRLLQAIEALK